MQQSILVVLGMHRSGTSLCAHLLHGLGIDMAEQPGASPANRRGHWERPRINDLNDRVFAMFGRPWSENTHALAMPERWWDDPRVSALRGELVGWLRPQLGGGAFGFKDPRTARLMPMWRAAFAELDVAPRFVFCVRDPAQVVRSVTARDRMGREQAEYRWAVYNADAIAGVGADPVCIIPYESWFTAPGETVARLAAHAGVAATPAAQAAVLAETIDVTLRHDAEAAHAGTGRALRRLHRAILGAVPANRFSDDLAAYAALLGEFAELVQPMLVNTEVLRASVAEQNRVIAELNTLVGRLRRAA